MLKLESDLENAEQELYKEEIEIEDTKHVSFNDYSDEVKKTHAGKNMMYCCRNNQIGGLDKIYQYCFRNKAIQ